MWRLRSQAHRGGGFRSSSQAPLDALHFRFEDDVSAGDERLDVSEAEILEQRPQVVHFDRAAADVDGAQKCYAPWHTPRAATRSIVRARHAQPKDPSRAPRPG